MSCTPISVSLEVDPTELRKIIFSLDKICNNDNTAEWKIHFELQERTDPAKDFRNVIKLDVDVNKEHHTLAEATANDRLDEGQRGQAAIAGEMAKAAATDPTLVEDAKTQVAAILPARNTASNAAVAV